MLPRVSLPLLVSILAALGGQGSAFPSRAFPPCPWLGGSEWSLSVLVGAGRAAGVVVRPPPRVVLPHTR